MILSVHQPQYIPWLGYFDKINKSNCFVFLDTVQYKTREFINRNKIRTSDGWIWLTVPVKTGGNSRAKISEVLIDNERDWNIEHKRSLQVCYGKAPFFKEYFHFFEEVYEKKWDKLIDLNIYIIRYILKQLEINTQVLLESEIGTETKSTERIIELCRNLKADVYLSGIGGKDYLQEGRFKEEHILLQYQNFPHPNYTQQFISQTRPFEPYMSVIDLLFNEGPRSREILKKAWGNSN